MRYRAPVTDRTETAPKETERANATRVAFLGLGRMGFPMARRLARSGLLVSVWNRSRAFADRFAREEGVAAAASPAACAEGADVVVTMVADGSALASVLDGEQGVVRTLAPDAVVVDMSTVGRRAALDAHRIVTNVGARFVDAPVSGSVRPAEEGTLVALVGGERSDVERVRPVLLAMCARVLYAGGVGQGQALKVVLNGLGAMHLAAFATQLALGERAGLSRDVLVEAFTQGAFASPSYVGKKQKVLAGDYTPEFTLALARKDAQLNRELQDEAGLPLAAHREALRLLEDAVDRGLGELDLFALEKLFSDKAST
jgi:3-hydroxyisobutyrate dehydrogenase-like beta-hydroxyacid dehydrogenase